MSKKQENIGVIFALASAAMWGMFPVLVNQGTQSIPPITFAAITTLFAAGGSFIYAATEGELHELKNKKAYVPLIMVTFLIVIIPYILFFIGSSKTSGMNSSLLLLSEIIFMLLFTPFIGEKNTAKKLLGSLGIFAGALLILYNGKFDLNTGDLLIIASAVTYPVGNFYAKKALNSFSPAIVLFARFLLGGLFILAVALIVEPQANISDIVSTHWRLILFTGLILLGLSKILWYEGLKRLDISKAISLSATFPLFSLIILIGFFKETPSSFQWIGIIIMAIGVYFSIKRASVDSASTKYAD
ncbi:MAG: DMT family transporter [bacterium]